MSTVKCTTLEDKATGSQASVANLAGGQIRAWATIFGGHAGPTLTVGNGGIVAQYNIASVTKNSSGDYTFTFTNAMPDANYAVLVSASSNGTSPGASVGVGGKRQDISQTTTTFRVVTGSVGTAGSVPSDLGTVNVLVVR